MATRLFEAAYIAKLADDAAKRIDARIQQRWRESWEGIPYDEYVRKCNRRNNGMLVKFKLRAPACIMTVDEFVEFMKTKTKTDVSCFDSCGWALVRRSYNKEKIQLARIKRLAASDRSVDSLISITDEEWTNLTIFESIKV